MLNQSGTRFSAVVFFTSLFLAVMFSTDGILRAEESKGFADSTVSKETKKETKDQKKSKKFNKKKKTTGSGSLKQSPDSSQSKVPTDSVNSSFKKKESAENADSKQTKKGTIKKPGKKAKNDLSKTGSNNAKKEFKKRSDSGQKDRSNVQSNGKTNSGSKEVGKTTVYVPQDLPAAKGIYEISNDDFKPANEIDRLVIENLKKQKLQPSPLCSDAVFIRRVYIDLVGTIPDPQTATDFIRNPSSNKRVELIEDLLAQDRFVDYWAMKWCDLLRVKSEFPINLWPNGAAVYHRWIQQAFRENMPYDQFARALLTGNGSNFRSGPANFYRAVQMRDASSLAEAVGTIFLGVQIMPWPEDRQQQFAQFFSRVGYKGSAQWKEEIVFWNRKPLDTSNVVFPDGTKGVVPENRDPREVFADWLIRPENKAFNENIVNRIWFWLLGRGIVHEPDNFREDNPPCCPGLLEYLAKELVTAQYDLKQIYRLILNSRTYQQSSLAGDDYLEKEKYFAVYPTRRIEAEVLQDIFIQIFRLQLSYMSEVPEPYAFLPPRLQTVELSDAGITNSFLEMFGRSTRDTGTETDRNNDVTASQELFFINSNEVNNWARRAAQRFTSNVNNAAWNRPNAQTGSKGVNKRNVKPAGTSNQTGTKMARNNSLQVNSTVQIANFLWLTFLSRLPSQAERDNFNAFRELKRNNSTVLEDYIWLMINSKEFLCRH